MWWWRSTISLKEAILHSNPGLVAYKLRDLTSMRKSKAIIRVLAVGLFLLLAGQCFAQFPVQDTADHGAMDTLYFSCTAHDLFEKDSITVSFDLICWTDAYFPNERIVGWS